MLELGLVYAFMGVPIFPVEPRGKEPLTRHGVKDATTDDGQVAAWAAEHPSANIGLATGKPSGLVVLDLDTPDAVHNIPDTLDVPVTLTVGTGRGFHLYYRLPTDRDARNTASKWGEGVDSRGTGGYVLAAGSIHPNGRMYGIAHEAKPVTCPDWLLHTEPKAPEQPPSPPRFDDGDGTPFGVAALRSELIRLLQAAPGTRNHTLNKAAMRIGQLVGGGELHEGPARDKLEAAAFALWSASGDKPNAAEIRKTINSGLSAGKDRPRSRQVPR